MIGPAKSFKPQGKPAKGHVRGDFCCCRARACQPCGYGNHQQSYRQTLSHIEDREASYSQMPVFRQNQLHVTTQKKSLSLYGDP